MREPDLDEFYYKLPNPDDEIRDCPDDVTQTYADIGREPIVYLAPEAACIGEIYAIPASQAIYRRAIRSILKNVF